MRQKDRDCIIANVAVLAFKYGEAHIDKFFTELDFLTRDEVVVGLNALIETVQVHVSDNRIVEWIGVQ